jgi:hypothetical protein
MKLEVTNVAITQEIYLNTLDQTAMKLEAYANSLDQQITGWRPIADPARAFALTRRLAGLERCHLFWCGVALKLSFPRGIRHAVNPLAGFIL